MANIRLVTTTRNALAQVFQTLIDAGAAGGTIKLYDGAQPATAGGTVTNLLATITFPDPSAPAASGGTLSLDADPDIATTASASGTVTWARIADSNGVTVFDCDVATSGATITIDNAVLVSGAPVTLTAFTITIPSGE